MNPDVGCAMRTTALRRRAGAHGAPYVEPMSISPDAIRGRAYPDCIRATSYVCGGSPMSTERRADISRSEYPPGATVDKATPLSTLRVANEQEVGDAVD